jgi:hypothetical protein
MLLALSGAAVAADSSTKSVEQIATEAATTPEQHQTLADFYKQKAADAREEATKHRNMASTLVSRSPDPQTAMRNHCAALADAATKAAAEYDALAKLHEDEAKTAK